MMKLVLLSLLALAAPKQGAHTHGEGEINIAFDGKKGRIEWRAPAESIYGFEHQARSVKDQNKKDRGLKNLEEKIQQMIVFKTELKCEVKKDMFEVMQNGPHANIEADFNVSCEASPQDSTVTFNIRKVFPRFRKVQVNVLMGDVQKSVTVEKDGTEIEIK